MSSTQTLLDRNRAFSSDFAARDLPIMPKLGTIVLTCTDSRVDPAHFAGLELGDAGVIRNAGARVTPEVIRELAILSFLARQFADADTRPLEFVIIQHSDCGAERFANPQLQEAIQKQLGIDVSPTAITDHEGSIHEDVEQLRHATELPKDIVVSAFIYDVHDGQLRQVVAPSALTPAQTESEIIF